MKTYIIIRRGTIRAHILVPDLEARRVGAKSILVEDSTHLRVGLGGVVHLARKEHLYHTLWDIQTPAQLNSCQERLVQDLCEEKGKVVILAPEDLQEEIRKLIDFCVVDKYHVTSEVREAIALLSHFFATSERAG